jgi:CheY-like chemotaxis protein
MDYLQNGNPRPDLILLDLNMPRMDGRIALREIKSDPQLKDIPVVILTTPRQEKNVKFCFDAVGQLPPKLEPKRISVGFHPERPHF